MITSTGRGYIKRYLAGQVPAIAQCIAFGLGGKAEWSGDTTLQFEVGRSPLTITSFDYVADKIIYKADLPADYAGTIYEVALYTQLENPTAAGFGSRILTTFDSDSEVWSTDGGVAVYSSAFARIGGDSINHTPAANASSTSTLADLFLDLSGNSAADNFVVAFNSVNANVANIRVRFMVDAGNYYDVNLGPQTAGYKIVSVAKGTATVTGVPSWQTIRQIQVTTTASISGPVDVAYDGIRIEDTDTVNPEYVMISRELLAQPFVRRQGMSQEVEFALGVTIV